jgi:hypothetical protein
MFCDIRSLYLKNDSLTSFDIFVRNVHTRDSPIKVDGKLKILIKKSFLLKATSFQEQVFS